MKSVTVEMEDKKPYKKNKGGRPSKVVKRNQLLGVKCSLIEKKIIEHKAKGISLSVSEYLRGIALNSQQIFNRKTLALPKEVLLFSATLNHLAANMNQVAYKRNRGDDLNALERVELFVLINELKFPILPEQILRCMS
jgi:hypothetical protein